MERLMIFGALIVASLCAGLVLGLLLRWLDSKTYHEEPEFKHLFSAGFFSILANLSVKQALKSSDLPLTVGFMIGMAVVVVTIAGVLLNSTRYSAWQAFYLAFLAWVCYIPLAIVAGFLILSVTR